MQIYPKNNCSSWSYESFTYFHLPLLISDINSVPAFHYLNLLQLTQTVAIFNTLELLTVSCVDAKNHGGNKSNPKKCSRIKVYVTQSNSSKQNLHRSSTNIFPKQFEKTQKFYVDTDECLYVLVLARFILQYRKYLFLSYQFDSHGHLP